MPRCEVTIYMYYNKVTGKMYIGSTNNLSKRLSEHLRDSKVMDYKFYRAVRKYGWDSFSLEILEKCCSLIRSLVENKWIMFYDSIRLGYNSVSADFKTISAETISKRSNSLRGRKNKPMSRETRDRMSKAKIGKKIGPWSETHRENQKEILAAS